MLRIRNRRIRGWPAACGWLLAFSVAPLSAEPIALKRPEATFCAGGSSELTHVVNGVEAEPRGWSVQPRLAEPQALILACARPVEAAELDITLFFLSGRPNNSIAEFALSYTADAEPSLGGNWQPLEIQRFSAEVATLQRTPEGRLRAAVRPDEVTGTIPDDTYRVTVFLPARRATGFRLQAFPVFAYDSAPAWMAWGSPHDFVLTELRVEERARETTNIALHGRAGASHPLCGDQRPDALTDGLPATLAHPRDGDLGTNFHFEVDLGRPAVLDHIGLRTRGDQYDLARFSRIRVNLYAEDPTAGAAPSWTGMIRADGSYPEAGEVDIVRSDAGRGTFRGRYLRVSSDSQVPFSPQLAEVEAYEARTPELVSARADGAEIPAGDGLDLPPGVRRLSLQLRIPQIGRPSGAAFRWRLRGVLEDWQESRLMTLDMACPPPGRTVFEAQALHSDRQWDQSVYRLPIRARQHFWETRLFRWTAVLGGIATAAGLAFLWARRRTARQLATLREITALAEERARIARDIHDDLGASLTHIALLGELAQGSFDRPEQARAHVDDMFRATNKLTRTVDEVVWALNPSNDTLARFGSYLGDYAQEFLQAAGMDCRLSFPADWPDRALPPKTRHHLFLVIKEALHNSVAHSGATTVRLEIRIDGGTLRMTVADNGRGFDPDAAGGRPGGGHGLANMRRRISELGGTFSVASGPGQGCAVTMEVAL